MMDATDKIMITILTDKCNPISQKTSYCIKHNQTTKNYNSKKCQDKKTTDADGLADARKARQTKPPQQSKT